MILLNIFQKGKAYATFYREICKKKKERSCNKKIKYYTNIYN